MLRRRCCRDIGGGGSRIVVIIRTGDTSFVSFQQFRRHAVTMNATCWIPLECTGQKSTSVPHAHRHPCATRNATPLCANSAHSRTTSNTINVVRPPQPAHRHRATVQKECPHTAPHIHAVMRHTSGTGKKGGKRTDIPE